MKIVLASDHAGFALKEVVKAHLHTQGYTIVDVSSEFVEDDDYPPVIRKGCEKVLKEDAIGIIFGGSGNGEAIVANKIKGIRAAVCWNEEIARLARAHNDANVMSLGGRFIDEELAKKMVNIFLSTEFEGGRHKKRVDAIE
ncbi:ribose 5-phosphate isomerase B [Candidatus Peregrinibacteria bacterium CG10_big_fil_rev_8_21_14_0_10_49_16]|nr:MAG: ribose 5-phosphate isomerase B [Candidatus Peregrinibacteria bacterium CG22_combo_CG10-13_8_21_14_all_49_11]PIR51802.1 MAG: ribose 5-phosphate isomerase B [Candidatus Peregrinibacteria bacterium CG10_big_fil_rev_8_21_14_0_10_49_16]